MTKLKLLIKSSFAVATHDRVLVISLQSNSAGLRPDPGVHLATEEITMFFKELLQLLVIVEGSHTQVPKVVIVLLQLLALKTRAVQLLRVEFQKQPQEV
jgi:hypothetical protein